MSQADYDAVKATYPGQTFEGVVAYYWERCGSCGRHHRQKMALRLDDRSALYVDEERWRLPVADGYHLPLPEGTRVRIEVPPGSLGPLNHYTDEVPAFRAGGVAGTLWLSEHPRPPEPPAAAPEE